MTDFLFYGDSERSAAMRHELPVPIGDPFLLGIVGGQLHVMTNSLERSRVEAAAHLLTGTDLSIGSIAARCGFRSAETLRLAFTAAYGVSPSQYRATQSRPAARSSPA